MDAAKQEDRKAAIKGKLSERVTQYSPELQQLEMRKFLLTEMNDALADLTEEAIASTSMIRTLHGHVIALPGSLAFSEHMASLSRSRKRLGRMEGTILTDRPATNIQPSKHDKDVEEERQYREALNERPSFWRRLFGGG